MKEEEIKMNLKKKTIRNTNIYTISENVSIRNAKKEIGEEYVSKLIIKKKTSAINHFL